MHKNLSEYLKGRDLLEDLRVHEKIVSESYVGK